MRDGNYDVAIPHVKREDEIGTIARAVEGFRENFVQVARQDNERKNAEATAERKSILGKLDMNPDHLLHRFAYLKNEIPVAGCALEAAA